MRKFVLLIGVPLVALLAACTESDAPQTTAKTAAGTPSAAAPAADEHAADAHAAGDHQDAPVDPHDPATGETAAAAPEEPAEITLASGEQVKVLSVVYFDENVKNLSGLVAIEGKVKESHADRGALILVDCSVEAGCTDGCCPSAEVPVRLDLSTYDGSLPAADSEVVLIGDLTVLDMGYQLAVREIRQGEQVLLTQKS